MAAPEPPFKRPRAVKTAHEAEASRMCKFIREGFEYQPFKHEKPLDDEIKESIQWSCKRTPEEIIAYRNKLADWIDSRAAHFRDSGEADRWLEEADPVVRQVSKGVNGPLMEVLAKAIGYHGPDVIQFFRTGAPLVCLFVCTCVGSGFVLCIHSGGVASFLG